MTIIEQIALYSNESLYLCYITMYKLQKNFYSILWISLIKQLFSITFLLTCIRRKEINLIFCVTRQNTSPATRFISVHKVHTAGNFLLLCRYREMFQLHSCSLQWCEQRVIPSYIHSDRAKNANARLIMYHYLSPGFAKVKSYEWWYTCVAQVINCIERIWK